MFGRTCSLCGGKLDGNLRCRECGLDNTQSFEYYSKNGSHEGVSLTHVHEEDGSVHEAGNASVFRRQKASNKPNQPRRKSLQEQTYEQRGEPGQGREYGQTADPASGKVFRKRTDKDAGSSAAKDWQEWQGVGNRKKPKKKAGCLVWFIILFVIFECIGFAGSLFDDMFDDWDSDYSSYDWDDSDYDYDPYANLYEEIGEGEEYTITLDDGFYIVGENIPAGYYEAECEEDWGCVAVTDPNHEINFTTSAEDFYSYMDDIRLFDGALVEINTGTEATITLTTENAQDVDQLGGIENPNTKEYVLSIGEDEQAVAGIDFEPGVYDVSSDDMEVDLVVETEEGDEYDAELTLGDDLSRVRRNIYLPKGATLESPYGTSKFTLTPSEKVSTTDYMDYYNTYYFY